MFLRRRRGGQHPTALQGAQVNINEGVDIRRMFVGAHARVAIGSHISWQEAPTLPPAWHQLPPDVSHFTGRRDAIQRLSAAATDRTARSRRIWVVVGKPGVGRSAFAVHLAHHLMNQFPDGQLHVDFGSEVPAIDATEALRRLLVRLGVSPEVIPTHPEDRAAVFRSFTAEKRLLVVLDNVSSSSQVTPLIPPGKSAFVIAVSRSTLPTLNGAAVEQLDVLAEEESLGLLEAACADGRVGRELQSARQVVELCGHLPLAVRIVGAQLRSRPHMTVAELAERLEDDARRLRNIVVDDLSLVSAFRAGYDSLTDDEAIAYCLLDVVPARDFEIHQVSALLELSAEDAEACLERLVDAQMLEATDKGRYRFHDLLRLFAHEQIGLHVSAQDQSAAVERVIRAYAVEARAWFHGLDVGEDPQTLVRPAERHERMVRSLSRFDANRAGVLAAIDLAHDRRLFSQVCELATCTVPYFLIRSSQSDAEHAARLALDAADRTDDPHLVQQALDDLSVVRAAGGAFPEAIALATRSVQLCRELADERAEALALANLGAFQMAAGEHQSARNSLNSALDRLSGTDEPINKGSVLNNLGLLNFALGMLNEALEYYHADLGITRQEGDRHGEGTTLDNIAKVYVAQGHLDKATGYFRRNVDICRDLGDFPGACKSLTNLGFAYLQAGKVRRAEKVFGELGHLARDTHAQTFEGFSFYGLGLSSMTRHRLGASTRHLAHAVEALEGSGEPNWAGEAKSALAECRARRDARRKAASRILSIASLWYLFVASALGLALGSLASSMWGPLQWPVTAVLTVYLWASFLILRSRRR